MIILYYQIKTPISFDVSRIEPYISYSTIISFIYKCLVNEKYFTSLIVFKKKKEKKNLRIFFFLVIQMGVIVFIYNRSDVKFTKKVRSCG